LCLAPGGPLPYANPSLSMDRKNLFLGLGCVSLALFLYVLNAPKPAPVVPGAPKVVETAAAGKRSEEHTSELQSLRPLVCRLLLEKKKQAKYQAYDSKQ